MRADTLVVQVADLPVVKEHIERLEWQVECLETMLRSPWCSQCGNRWADGACGPTHAAIAANHPAVRAPGSAHSEEGGKR